MDIETPRFKPDWRLWKKVKGGDMSDEYSDWVPRNILYFDRFVEELFVSENPMQMIDDAKSMLAGMRGMRQRGGNADNNFSNLFDSEEVVLDKSVESTFAMPMLNEDKLDQLEVDFLEMAEK
jgi:hypothetical protein